MWRDIGISTRTKNLSILLQRILLCKYEIRTATKDVKHEDVFFFPDREVDGYFLNALREDDLFEISKFAQELSIDIKRGNDEDFFLDKHPNCKNDFTWSNLVFSYHEGIVYDETGYPKKPRIRKVWEVNEAIANRFKFIENSNYVRFSVKQHFKIWKGLVEKRMEQLKRDEEKEIERRKKYNYTNNHSRDYGGGCPRCSEWPCMCSDPDAD